MRCYKCGNVLDEGNTCSNCGVDVTHYKKIIGMSDIHYNEGLEQASVHDLSGAEVSLRKSLHYNKRNVQARNLLGLVLYERGHLSEALAEWIISCNVQSGDNPATEYVRYFQNPTSGRKQMDEEVRNYNTCLEYLKSGNEDLAVLHLKKVLASEPKLVEAYQLMALLCMKNHQYTQARKYLKTAVRMDRGNLRTLQYITALQNMGGGGIDLKLDSERVVTYNIGNETIIQPKTTEKSGNATGLKRFMSSKNIGLVLLAAAVITWFLIIPAYVKSASAKAADTVRAYNEDMVEKEVEIQQLTKERDEARASEAAALGTSDDSIGTIQSYEILISMQSAWNSGSYDDEKMLESLTRINRDNLEENGQAVYDKLRNNVFDEALASLYRKGKNEYDWGNWKNCIEYLEKVCTYDEGYNDAAALYYLGAAAQEDRNNAKARASFEKLAAEFPDSAFVSYARERLNELNVASSGSGSE